MGRDSFLRSALREFYLDREPSTQRVFGIHDRDQPPIFLCSSARLATSRVSIGRWQRGSSKATQISRQGMFQQSLWRSGGSVGFCRQSRPSLLPVPHTHDPSSFEPQIANGCHNLGTILACRIQLPRAERTTTRFVIRMLGPHRGLEAAARGGVLQNCWQSRLRQIPFEATWSPIWAAKI